MILAIEMVKDRATREPYDFRERRGLGVYRHALERGVLLRPLGNVVYFMPPYVITPEEIDLLGSVALEAIGGGHMRVTACTSTRRWRAAQRSRCRRAQRVMWRACCASTPARRCGCSTARAASSTRRSSRSSAARCRCASARTTPVERESPLAVTLLQGIGRGEKMDLVLQKATELGVARIVPLLTARSTVQLDADRNRRASMPTGRQSSPAPASSAAAIACPACCPRRGSTWRCRPSPDALQLLLAPDADSPSLPTLLETRPGAAARGVTLLVGPEGGLDDDEIRRALHAGFTRCRLGPRVLRTETAALAALAALQSLAGDYR